MPGSANLKARLSSLGQLFLKQQGDPELLFTCLLNHRVALNTRMVAAWCIYEDAVAKAPGAAQFASVPLDVLKELSNIYPACLTTDPRAWRRFYRWPGWERKSEAALKRACRLVQQELARRHQRERSSSPFR